jgi:hypothetical protein
MPTYRCRQKPQVNEGKHAHHTHRHTPARTPRPRHRTARSPVRRQRRRTVLTLLRERGWALTHTPDANVHCTSPDARVYVGWLPEDPSAWRREALWTVHVTPDNGEPWTQDFGPDVPSHAVAGFLHALITPTHH